MLGSFRDPGGRVFIDRGSIYRLVRPAFAAHYDHAVASGFHSQAIQAGLLIPHREVDPSQARAGEPAHRVLRPEPLDFVSYPYEWCFGQLKEAALLTLRIARLALRFGLTLKDASAYNVQFRGAQPVFIDTTSFTLDRPGQLWAPYYQFCRHFLAPLALISKTRRPFGRELRVHLDGLPLRTVSEALPWHTWLQPGLLSHLHLHATTERVGAARRAVRVRTGEIRVQERGKVALLEHLEGVVRGLRSPTLDTEWAEYESTTHYSRSTLAHKREVIESSLVELRPGSVWDLGANTGRHAEIASGRDIFTVALDADPAAVERGFASAHARADRRLLHLWMDLTNPSPRLGWEHSERMSLVDRGPCELGLALALVHHLCIGQGIPLERIASGMRQLARNLLVEWVPPSDPMAAPLLARRPEGAPLYTQEHFEHCFGQEYDHVERSPLRDSQRALYLFRAKP